MKRRFGIIETVNTIKCKCGMEFLLYGYAPGLNADDTYEDRFAPQDFCDFCPYCGRKMKEK